MEDPLDELPTADDVTNPHSHGCLTNVPELVYSGLRAEEVVDPMERAGQRSIIIVAQNILTCSRWRR